MQTLDTSGLLGAYAPLGNPIPDAASIIKLVNGSDVPVTISTDGTTDMDILPAGSFYLYDLTTNKSFDGTRVIPAGTQFYVNGVAGSGLVYLVILHAGN
jgi:hypothetical protein